MACFQTLTGTLIAIPVVLTPVTFILATVFANDVDVFAANFLFFFIFIHRFYLWTRKTNTQQQQQQLLTSLRIFCEPNSLTRVAQQTGKKRVAIYFEWIRCFFFILQTFSVSQELNSFKIMSSGFNAVSHNFKSFWNYTDMMW